MSVKYEYIGRLDTVSGTVTMGLNYTNQTDPNATTPAGGPNGLLPDVAYSVMTTLEDCPYARTEPTTESLKAVYIPHDHTTLNLKNAADTNSTLLHQRLSILILGAPQASQVGRITVVQNWEAIPSRQMADLMTLSYNTFPSNFSGKAIYDHMVANNLIITKSESEFGRPKFLEQLKIY